MRLPQGINFFGEGPVAIELQLGLNLAGDEAVKLFEQHRLLAKGKQFLVKLLEATRQAGQGRQMVTSK